MPCSKCGMIGHNIRTCPSLFPAHWRRFAPPGEAAQPAGEPAQPAGEPGESAQPVGEAAPDGPRPVADADEDDAVFALLCHEMYIRKLIIQDEVYTMTDDEIKYSCSLLGIKKMEFRLINLERVPIYIYLIDGNNHIQNLDSQVNRVTYLGKIYPRMFMNLTSFTGYRYVFVEGRFTSQTWASRGELEEIIHQRGSPWISTLDIHDKMRDTININSDISKLMIDELNRENLAIHASIKMNFLIKELIRFGGLDNPNFEPILDLHRDIDLPEYDLIDLEAAGVPNELTNVT